MITFECNILCDVEECNEYIVTEPVDPDAIYKAIEESLLEEEWTKVQGPLGTKHYCPKCSKELIPKEAT
jgi:hypothetical protein